MGDEKKVLERWDRPEVIQTLQDNGLDRELKENYTFKQRGLWHSITFAAINLYNVRSWKKMKGEFYYSQKAGANAAKSMNETWNFVAKLDSCPFPVYVIHGDDDYIPLSKHQEWTENIKHVELKVINKAGHLSWIDQPKIVSELIHDYLNKIQN